MKPIEERAIVTTDNAKPAVITAAEFVAGGYDEMYDDDDEHWGGAMESNTCPRCNGTGLDFTGLEDCDYCFGVGYKWW